MKNEITKLDPIELKYDKKKSPKASKLAIKARHPKLVEYRAFLILAIHRRPFLRYHVSTYVITVFECDFVF
jgi:hypothetical protein